jgi:hypothetical protein
MELVKYDSQRLCPALTPTEQSIVLATQAKRISEMNLLDVANLVTDLISKTIIVLGHKSKEQLERSAIEPEIVRDLITDYKNMTIEEVKAAFHLGSRGKFATEDNKVIFISVAMVYSWLKAYRETIRKEAMGKQLRFEQDNPMKKEPTEAEKFDMEVYYALENLSQPQILEVQGNAIYNTLEKLKLIQLTSTRKKEIYAQAELEFRNKHSKGRDLNEVQINKKIIALLEAGDSSTQTKIKCLAKFIALMDFLKNVNEMEDNIIEMVKEAYAEHTQLRDPA